MVGGTDSDTFGSATICKLSIGNTNSSGAYWQGNTYGNGFGIYDSDGNTIDSRGTNPKKSHEMAATGNIFWNNDNRNYANRISI